MDFNEVITGRRSVREPRPVAGDVREGSLPATRRKKHRPTHH
jgi:hypothetical protein